MDCLIRPVRDDDAQGLADLLNPLIELGTVTIMTEPITAEGQRDYLREFPPRGVFFVAEEGGNGRLVGMQSVEPIYPAIHAFHHVGEIATFVAVDAHRKGIARALSKATFKACREAGFLKIRATIRADNPLGLGFYTGMGFEIIGTAMRHARVRGELVDEVLAERFLD